MHIHVELIRTFGVPLFHVALSALRKMVEEGKETDLISGLVCLAAQLAFEVHVVSCVHIPPHHVPIC